MEERAASLIAELELLPHPEGGYYCEVFRSAASVTADGARGERSALTTIYFLLAAGQQSRWHRVRSDEVWHYYEGDPLELFWLEEDRSRCHHVVLGPADEEMRPVAVVPAKCWQATRPMGSYTLVGCTVGPGFDFADFCLPEDDPESAAEIRQRFPELASLL